MKSSLPPLLLAALLAAGLAGCSEEEDGDPPMQSETQSGDEPAQQGDETVDSGPAEDDGRIGDEEEDPTNPANPPTGNEQGDLLEQPSQPDDRSRQQRPGNGEGASDGGFGEGSFGGSRSDEQND